MYYMCVHIIYMYKIYTYITHKNYTHILYTLIYTHISYTYHIYFICIYTYICIQYVCVRVRVRVVCKHTTFDMYYWAGGEWCESKGEERRAPEDEKLYG